MKLSNLSIEEFADLLGSSAPAPGGGSASALAGALGAALTCMVANLTTSKAKLAEFHDIADEVEKKASALQGELIVAIDKDTEAFNSISAAFAMPKATDEEKAARTAAIQTALIVCTESPLRIMELAGEALGLTREIVGRSNSSAASDLGVSALFLKTAILGGWLNVLINISSIKDEIKAESYKKKGEDILAKSVTLADEIYEEIKASL